MKMNKTYNLSVKELNNGKTYQSYLEASEIAGNTLNMSGRSSIKMNKSMRRKQKYINIVESALKKVAIILMILLVGQVSFASLPESEVEIIKKELLNVQNNTISIAIEKDIEQNLCENLAFTDQERFNKECNTKETIENIQEAVELQEERVKEVIEVNKPFDIDKLAYAVSMQETKNCTLGYGKTHNNCFGIKHGNTVPCPGVPKMAMCKFETPEESYEAFKIIWSKWYGKLPNREMAVRWSGNDRADIWKKNVLYYYNK